MAWHDMKEHYMTQMDEVAWKEAKSSDAGMHLMYACMKDTLHESINACINE